MSIESISNFRDSKQVGERRFGGRETKLDDQNQQTIHDLGTLKFFIAQPVTLGHSIRQHTLNLAVSQ